MNAGLVYQVRAYDKKRGARGGSAPKGKPGRKPGPQPKAPKFKLYKGGGTGDEEAFKRLLASIGIDRARALIDEAASWGRVFGVVK